MRLVAGGVGALTLLGAGAGVAAGGGSHEAKWVTVHDAWVLDTLEEAEVFVLPDGTMVTEEPTEESGELPPPGSMFFFQDEIYAAADSGTARGERIGTSYGKCTAGTGAALCDVHASIDARGTVEFKLAFTFTEEGPAPGEPFRVAITGGTGEYAGISGEALLYEDQDVATDDRLELDAVIPAAQLDHDDQADQLFTTTLSGAAEVPGPGDLDGTGHARLTVNGDEGTICYELTVSGIAPAAAAHIHEAPAGTAGPIVVTLTAPTEGHSADCEDVDQELARDISAHPERYYVNVHNAEFPAGALRGQL